MVFVFIEILFKMLLFKGGVLIYAEHCISDGQNKVYSFICSIVYFVVSQNTLFIVIPFHHLSDCDLYTPPTTGQEENDQPGQNEELVPKRGTTFVAWSRDFKHCSFKTTDFKLLKLKQSYMHAPSLSVWEEHTFSFLIVSGRAAYWISHVGVWRVLRERREPRHGLLFIVGHLQATHVRNLG